MYSLRAVSTCLIVCQKSKVCTAEFIITESLVWILGTNTGSSSLGCLLGTEPMALFPLVLRGEMFMCSCRLSFDNGIHFGTVWTKIIHFREWSCKYWAQFLDHIFTHDNHHCNSFNRSWVSAPSRLQPTACLFWSEISSLLMLIYIW